MEKPIRILPLSRGVDLQPFVLRKAVTTNSRAHFFRKEKPPATALGHFRTLS
jgi:hypothetical protein